MNKYRPKELMDLNQSKQRVMQNVEAKLDKRSQRSWYQLAVPYVMAAVLIFGIALFTALILDGTKENAATNDTLHKSEYYEKLHSYFAPDGAVAVYNVLPDGEVMSIEQVVYTNWLDDYHVQLISTIAEGQGIEQIYRIEDNSIKLVYEEKENADTKQRDKTNLYKNKPLETLITEPLQKNVLSNEWRVLETKSTEILNSTILNAVQIAKQVKNQEVTKTFVPTIGLTSEQFIYEGKMATKSLSYFALNGEVNMHKDPSQFDKLHVPVEPNFHTAWKKSLSNTYQATIEGKGEQASEEGEGIIVVEDQKLNERFLLKLTDNYLGQYTPKEIVWIDDERMLVIIGMSHGMVTMGGQVHLLNVRTGDSIPVYTDLPKNSEVSSIERDESGNIQYQLFVYDTDNLDTNESHQEEGEIEILRGYIEKVTEKTVQYRKVESGGNVPASERTLHSSRKFYMTDSEGKLIHAESPKGLSEIILLDGEAVAIIQLYD